MIYRLLFIISMLFILPASTLAAGTTPPSTHGKIIMETTLGTIKIDLFDEKAPLTCENFRRYIHEGFFNGLIFHRVIPGFVIQGGGFEPGMKKRPTHPPIVNEADNGLKNTRGTLSMARTQDIYSATSQFFINVADNQSLDHQSKTTAGFGYAVFGKVVEGMDVVDRIVKVPTGSMGFYNDVPEKDVVIVRAYEEK